MSQHIPNHFKAMQVIESIEEMQAYAIHARTQGKLIGLVATMGALHEGHLSLIDMAKEKTDIVVVSIFVNPTQFGPNEDFDKYPRPIDADLKACEARGADIVFMPQKKNIYPEGFSTYVTEDRIGEGMCGQSRPGHFKGVTTVVNILFNITRPDVAVFGQKDAQQCAVIKKMVKDLVLPIEVVIAPTIRESDGLAMSSRNRYLDAEQRAEATKIYQALLAAKELVAQGHHAVERIQAEVMNRLNQGRRIRIIYVSIVDVDTMQPLKEIVPGKSLVAVAIWLDAARLIDNMVI